MPRAPFAANLEQVGSKGWSSEERVVLITRRFALMNSCDASRSVASRCHAKYSLRTRYTLRISTRCGSRCSLRRSSRCTLRVYFENKIHFAYIIHYMLHTTYNLPHTTYCLLLTTYCILLTAYCLLLTTDCLLLTTHYLLLTTYCILLTTYY